LHEKCKTLQKFETFPSSTWFMYAHAEQSNTQHAVYFKSFYQNNEKEVLGQSSGL
jgi:hypothetical protein